MNNEFEDAFKNQSALQLYESRPEEFRSYLNETYQDIFKEFITLRMKCDEQDRFNNKICDNCEYCNDNADQIFCDECDECIGKNYIGCSWCEERKYCKKCYNAFRVCKEVGEDQMHVRCFECCNRDDIGTYLFIVCLQCLGKINKHKIAKCKHVVDCN